MAVDESVLQVIYDKMEKNPKLIKLLKDAGAKEELLMLSKFMPLHDPETNITRKDVNAFDFTNEAITGGGELKQFGDMVGSLTGEGVKKEKIFNEITEETFWHYTVNDGLYQLWKQVIKMYSTGLPWCIIVYGSRYVFQKKSGVGDGLIVQAILKLVTLCTIYKGTVYFVKNEEEAVKVMKTFLKKSIELPRRWPIYNLFKRVEDDQVAMHAGITGFGIEIPRAIAEAGHRPCDIGYDAKRVELGEITEDEFLHKYGGSRKADKKTKVEGMGMDKARTLFKAYTDKWGNDDPNK